MGLFRGNSKICQEVKKAAESKDVLRKIVKDRYKELGKWKCHEIQVAVTFTIMVLILVFAKPGFMTGWEEALNMK